MLLKKCILLGLARFSSMVKRNTVGLKCKALRKVRTLLVKYLTGGKYEEMRQMEMYTFAIDIF